MKIPVFWLKNYIKTTKSTKEIAESFTALGLLLDKPIIKLENGEEVLDLEHRMDRADWLSILGCARDLAAFEKTPLIKPEIDETVYPPIADKEKVKLSFEDNNFVNRFYTRIIKNIKVQKSPEWLQKALESYGIPSINNVVDVTNYVMVELGQPMHAHAISKMTKREIHFRRAKDGEEITTLLGEKIKLDESVYITTENNKPTGVAAIVGGKDIAIDENTTDIILDAGNYNQALVRKTSRKLKIYNETVLRTDKFLHPYLCEIAVKRATKLLLELGGPNVEVFENEDAYPNKPHEKVMKLRTSRIKQISGIDFTVNDSAKTLKAMEYEILEQDTTSLSVKIPYFRTDIEVEDDVAADILRMYNYANIAPAPINSAPPKEITPEIYKFEQKLRDILVKIGMHEHITDPIVKHDNEKKDQVLLQNALSSEKNALRTSIYETLNPIVGTYQKNRQKEAPLFEIGNEYYLDENGKACERRVLQVIYRHFDKSYFEQNGRLREILYTLLGEVGIYPKISAKGIIMTDKKLGSVYVDSFSIAFTGLEIKIKENRKREGTIEHKLLLKLRKGESFAEYMKEETSVGKHYYATEENRNDVEKEINLTIVATE